MLGITRSFAGLAIVAIAATAAACSGGDAGVTQSQTGNAVIVLSEGSCDQTCPVYDMTLHPDGSYVLNGVKFVKTRGVSEGNLGADAWKKAQDALTEAGFWSQPTDQTSMVSENAIRARQRFRSPGALPRASRRRLPIQQVAAAQRCGRRSSACAKR